MMASNLLTIKEAAPLLRCSTVTLRRFVYSGKIGYKKIGSRYLFIQEHIQDFLNSVDVVPINLSTAKKSQTQTMPVEN
jgi:excisionase family DNA binding protein